MLTPPPVEPPPALVRLPGACHHTTSLLPATSVPPTASTFGLADGKSICAPPSLTWSPEPSSPDATQTVMPSSAAACRRRSTAVSATGEKPPGASSARPQLTDSDAGAGLAAITASSRSIQPFCVKFAK